MFVHERPAFVPAVALAALALAALGASLAARAEARHAGGPDADAGASAARPAPAAPRRIVSLALAADEVLLATVAPARIAALDEFVDDVASNVVEEARAVPRRVRPSVEEVLAAGPDLVFCSAWASAELRAAIARAGVPVELLAPPSTLAEVAENVRRIGRAVGDAAAADALAAEMDARLARTRARRAGRPRPRVVFRSLDGIAPGAGTLVEAMVEAAGGRLVPAELGMRGFSPLPAERALSLEVDLVLVDAYRGDGRARSIARDPLLSALARRARVLEVPPQLLQTTSHHVASTVEHLADLFEAEAP